MWTGVMSEAQEPQLMVGLDLREMTFQNVVDNILCPSGIKIGGFPEELFLNLTEQEHRDMMCNIWYTFSPEFTDVCNCFICTWVVSVKAFEIVFTNNAFCSIQRCWQMLVHSQYCELTVLQQMQNSNWERSFLQTCDLRDGLFRSQTDTMYLLRVHWFPMMQLKWVHHRKSMYPQQVSSCLAPDRSVLNKNPL